MSHEPPSRKDRATPRPQREGNAVLSSTVPIWAAIIAAIITGLFGVAGTLVTLDYESRQRGAAISGDLLKAVVLMRGTATEVLGDPDARDGAREALEEWKRQAQARAAELAVEFPPLSDEAERLRAEAFRTVNAVLDRPDAVVPDWAERERRLQTACEAFRAEAVRATNLLFLPPGIAAETFTPNACVRDREESLEGSSAPSR